MAAKVGDFSLILKLLGGIIIGALLGLYIGENAEGSLKHVMDVVVSLRHIFGQIIFFLVPLVIVGFITPAIVRLGQNASKILLVAVALAYVSSLGAALFSMISGYCIIPNLSIATSTETLRSLPEMVFRLDIPPLFSVMSALVLALTMGVAIVWTKSETLGKIFCEMERIMTALVNRIMIPILPFFVGLSFLGLGVTEPYTSWGLLLQAAQQGGFASFVDRPWVLWPGFFIFVSIMAWNFVGDGLRDAFDPRRRQ